MNVSNKDIEKIKKTISNLLNVRTENGCTEGEVENAMKLAQDMLAKYNLTMSEVEVGRAQESFLYRRNHFSDNVFANITKVTSTILLTTTPFSSGEWVRTATYIGQPGRVEVAKYLHIICKRAIKQADKEFKSQPGYKRLSLSNKIKALNSYLYGFTDRLSEKILAYYVDDQESRDALEVAEKYSTTEARKPLPNKIQIYGDVLDSGRRDAENVQLGEGIETKIPKLLK